MTATRPRAVMDAARQKAFQRRQLFSRTDRKFNRPPVILQMKGELRAETDPLIEEFLANGGSITRSSSHE